MRQPKIGEIVLVKDDNQPRRMWKLALIKEYILSKDGQIHTVIIQLPNVTSSHLRSKELISIHKSCIPHSRDTIKCTPVYIQM